MQEICVFIIQSFYAIIKSQHVYKYTECIFVVSLFVHC